jgi:hypothetical protein
MFCVLSRKSFESCDLQFAAKMKHRLLGTIALFCPLQSADSSRNQGCTVSESEQKQGCVLSHRARIVVAALLTGGVNGLYFGF